MLRLLFYVLLIFATSLSADAQVYYSGQHRNSAEDEIINYHNYRAGITEPPYGLARVRALIAKTKSDMMKPAVLDATTLDALSLREQFTYHMIHAESYHQICSMMPPVKDERRKIFAYVPDFFGSVGWSNRQVTFFSDHRDFVLALIAESTLQDGHMDANSKQLVVDLKAVKMIPCIIAQINREPKDHDLLTVLMLLMKDAAYPPFTGSPIYKKLYGEDADYRSGISYTKGNVVSIINLATAFSQSLKG